MDEPQPDNQSVDERPEDTVPNPARTSDAGLPNEDPVPRGQSEPPRRPPPRPKLESLHDDELWVVSVSEEAEDQELYQSELQGRIARGVIGPDAIVWREGLSDWMPVFEVPELRKFLPTDKTGGFLGTGLPLTFESAKARRSEPPPLRRRRSQPPEPSASLENDSDDFELNEPVALSPGLLFLDPPPLSSEVAEREDLPNPPPRFVRERTVPKAPLKRRLPSNPDLPSNVTSGNVASGDVTSAVPEKTGEVEEAPPSSGIPKLENLTAGVTKKKSEVDHDFLLGLPSDQPAPIGPPTIDLSDVAGGTQPIGLAPSVASPLAPTTSIGAPDSGVPEGVAPESDSPESDSPESGAPESGVTSSGPKRSAEASSPRSSSGHRRKKNKARKSAPAVASKPAGTRSSSSLSPGPIPQGPKSTKGKATKRDLDSSKRKAAAESKDTARTQKDSPKPFFSPGRVMLMLVAITAAIWFLARPERGIEAEPQATQSPSPTEPVVRQDPAPTVAAVTGAKPKAPSSTPTTTASTQTLRPEAAPTPARFEATTPTATPEPRATNSAPEAVPTQAAQAAATAAPPATDEPQAESAVNTSEGSEATGAAAASAEPAEPATKLPPFNQDAARAALGNMAAQAASCRKAGDPGGTARVVITFAPSGRATSATVNGPPFAGTATGGCIAATMRRAQVPAFAGDYISVSKTVTIY